MRGRIWSAWLTFVGAMALLPAGALPAGCAERPPVGHWVFAPEHVQEGRAADLAGRSPGTISKTGKLIPAGKATALQCDGSSDPVMIRNDYRGAALPKRDMTAEAWVRVDEPRRWGRIVGVFQRHAGSLKGWFLGFHENRFVFALQGDAGPAGMTVLHAPGTLHPGNWYHVAAAYDGRRMRLYMNGLLVGTATEQTGAIAYPPEAPYQLGAYHDGAEHFPLKGLLHEVRVYDRALSDEQIQAHYAAKAALLGAAPPLLMPGVFGSNMVLQRDRPLPIWGRTRPGDKVTVTCAGASAAGTADERGRWRATLPALPAGGPHDFVLSTPSGELVLHNVLVGEVWFCAGQSNLALGGKLALSRQELGRQNYPQIRLFTVPRESAPEPVDGCGGWWDLCVPWSVADFSAVGYVFGRRLNQELGVPVGLFNASWGGTPCETWISRKMLESNPEFAEIVARARKDVWLGSGLYNKMVHPLIPFAIRGVVWYQGEANVGRGYQYRTLFPAMIRDWRTRWGQGDFPFYYVQIAPFNYGGGAPKEENNLPCAELWESQRLTLSLPNTGMVVTTDITHIQDNHASNKVVIGERLALWALAKTYGKAAIVYSGPLYRSAKVEGDRIRISFDHVGGGLVSRDAKPLDWFRIAGEDRRFHPAIAEVDGPTVVVRSTEVKRPVAVRFAWSGIAQPNLMNKEGLPASPFRTDDWPGVTTKNR